MGHGAVGECLSGQLQKQSSVTLKCLVTYYRHGNRHSIRGMPLKTVIKVAYVLLCCRWNGVQQMLLLRVEITCHK